MSTTKRWGPYTSMKAMQEQGPLVIDRAEGVYVFDEDGRRYLDAHAALWLVNVGYGRREIIEAVARQAEKLSWFSSFGGFANRPSIELAERLIDLFKPDGMASVFLSNDGSEAMETALKMSRQYWKMRGMAAKTKLIGRQHAYHGVTAGALSVAGITANRRMFEPLLGDIRHAPAPYRNHCSYHPGNAVCTYACVREVERMIQFEDPSTVAAFVAEPIQAAGGVIIPPPDYLAQIREICTRYDVLLITDEVVTGFGRLGDWTGARHYGIQPDMMTFAKGITSGYQPLGATAVAQHILDAYMQGGAGEPELRHGNTYSGHPVAAAAALANIAIIERENLLERARAAGSHLGGLVDQIAKALPNHVADSGAEGLLGRVELRSDGHEPPGALGNRVTAKMREAGVIVRPAGDVITLSPPLIITDDQLDSVIETLHGVLLEVMPV